jgi:hypothetical protein
MNRFLTLFLLLAASATPVLASDGPSAMSNNPEAAASASACKATVSLPDFGQPAPEFRLKPPPGCDDYLCNLECQPTFRGGSCIQQGDESYCLCWM